MMSLKIPLPEFPSRASPDRNALDYVLTFAPPLPCALSRAFRPCALCLCALRFAAALLQKKRAPRSFGALWLFLVPVDRLELSTCGL